MKLKDGTFYKEGMTTWRWCHVPIAKPEIQKFENTKLSHWPNSVDVDDETRAYFCDLFATKEACIEDLQQHLVENKIKYKSQIASMRHKADELEKWLIDSELPIT